MPKYEGKLSVSFWLEAKDAQEVDRIVWAMLDGWNAATPDKITWDNAEWNQYEEEGNAN